MAVAQTMDVDEKSNAQAAKVSFAKLLAGNNKKIRDKGLKKLNSWLTLRSSSEYVFNEEDFMTIWTGLYYSMWMSDLPLVQEDLAESISLLIHCLKSNKDAALLFIKCGNVTIGQAWASLDQHRIDKFAMLVRRFLRQSLQLLENEKWELALTRRLMAIYKENILGAIIAIGFQLHFIEIFLEELAKVSKGELSSDVLMAILEPFARTAALTGDGRIRMQCEMFFRNLIKQTDVAIEYNEKFEAWQRAGFPGGNPNLMVKEEDEDNDDDEDEGEEEEVERSEPVSTLDPRAGSVHAYLPQIRPPALRVAKLMKKLSSEPNAALKGKRLMLTLHRRFKTLQKGKYPFAVGKLFSEEKENLRDLISEATEREVREELKRKDRRQQAKRDRKKKKRDSDENGAEKKSPKNKTKNKEKSGKTSPGKPMKDVKAGFVVTDADTDSNQKRKAEAEIPPGWIVDNGDAQPPAKKRRSNWPWQVTSDQPASVSEESEKPSPKTKQSAMKAAEPVEKKEIEVEAIEAKKTVEPVQTKKQSPKTSKSPVKKATSMMSTPTKSKKEVESPSTPVETSKENGGETEIVIKTKSPPKVPAFFSHAVAKVNKSATKKSPVSTPTSLLKETLVASLNNSKSGRRISFNLAKNMAQDKEEYLEQLKRSPQIIFDANRVPQQSALKPGLPPSPINPFYAMKLGIYKKQ